MARVMGNKQENMRQCVRNGDVNRKKVVRGRESRLSTKENRSGRNKERNEKTKKTVCM